MEEDDDNFGQQDSNIFEKGDIVGQGTYGIVYRGKLTETGEVIAIKKIKIDNNSEGINSTSLREITILRELSHPNIIELKNVICKESKLYLLMEYLDYDLNKFLQESGDEVLDEDTIKSFLYQTLDAIAYCHSRKIIHRDLKPANLLIDKNGKLKVTDFGLARAFSIPVRPYTKSICKNKIY